MKICLMLQATLINSTHIHMYIVHLYNIYGVKLPSKIHRT